MESLRGLTSSPASAYDELVTGQKSIRYHWQGILSVIRSLPGGLGERVESARRQLEESGATVNLLDDRAAPRWSLDPLPFVITPDEWSTIESGVIQRAHLLDAVLTDLYGPQTLLRQGLVPPMLVHANRHFLRPCRVVDGTTPAHRLAHRLSHYAVDLVRLGNGQWHVLADHTELPSGIAYALEIRRVLARAVPEAFRSIPVRHLRPFVERWHESLLALAPPGIDKPNMAVLTPGSLSATYFEHVYLSRALGVPLVEGGDLVARDGAVSIKTLAGLRPVHMLLRRLDSSFADPLELRADSALGITGLVETTRNGHLALANALGSGLAETPALVPFLEKLGEHLLGQKLELPSLDVWWLGEPAALAFALANIDLMIVRPCLGQDREPIIVGMLDPPEHAALLQRIRSHPGHFVAQYPVAPSLSPKWDGNSLAPSAVVLRVFASAEGESWRVLPGGLAREPSGDTCLRSLGRLNGILKDAWVLTEDSADVQLPPARRFHQLPVERGGGADLQSRVADNLYWLGRYIERLDGDARLLRTTVNRVAQGAVGPRDAVELRLLGRLLSNANLMSQGAALSAPENAAFQQGLASVAAENRGLTSALESIHRLTSAMRERFSVDMITAIGPGMAELRQSLLAARGNLDPLLAALDDIVRFVAVLSGLAQENMTRGTGWRFLDLGRRLERGQYIATSALGAFAQSPIDWDAAMRLALELCDSTITYRTRYLGQLQPAPVLDLVMLDDSNPRSLVFQLRALSQHLEFLGHASGVEVPALPHSFIEDLEGAVQQFAGDERAWRHEGLALAMLRDITGETERRLEKLSEVITRAWFSHVAAAQTVGSSTV
ncbi:MAG: circularly permuted type 2 ATP-grasp protein [Reyranella sp.]|uniref:circularly permuted type 2 ATP-grasp protein n=1 Tax=Reyranella sp. TaxID=1929291 RepID=UPI003D138A51